MDPDDIPFACDDALITTAIEASDFLEAKMAALAAHRTQVALDQGFFALSNNLGSQVWGTEYFRLARSGTTLRSSPRRQHDATSPWEDDLFSGVS